MHEVTITVTASILNGIKRGDKEKEHQLKNLFDATYEYVVEDIKQMKIQTG